MGFWQKIFPLVDVPAPMMPAPAESPPMPRSPFDGGEIQVERDEGALGGGKMTALDYQVMDSRIPQPLPPEFEQMREAESRKRADRDHRLRTYHRSNAQVLAGRGTYQGDEDEEHNG